MSTLSSSSSQDAPQQGYCAQYGSVDSFPCNANNGLTVVSFSLVTAFAAVMAVSMLGTKVRSVFNVQ
jgi:hypothetical protein